MQGSRIYSDFAPEIGWIRRQVARDVRSLGPSMRPLARFYTSERLRIVEGRGFVRLTDKRMGRPIPYLALWLADAMGLAETRLRRSSALALVYSSIAATVRDDIGERGPGNQATKVRLERFWSRRYAETLRRSFRTEREFQRASASADEEQKKFEAWNQAPLGPSSLRPFSAGFLRESSRYLVACALPPLIAVAQAAGRKEDAPGVAEFLTYFCMGWKIFDDLMDWEADLDACEMNRSSVLIYVRNRMGDGNPVDRVDALSWFISEEFVEDSYGAMIGFFLKARDAIEWARGSYLARFVEEQVDFQTDKRDRLLGSGSKALGDLDEGLRSVLGPRPLVGPRMRRSLPWLP